MEGLVKRPDPEFWAGKRVLLTGHTGFKGAWLALWLKQLGADVTAFALPPEGTSLFDIANVDARCKSTFCDLRNEDAVRNVVSQADPEIVLHLAAQALVRRSMTDPLGTIATNVQGTAHLLEAVANAPEAKAVLVVTSDKVYRNDGAGRAFIETDPLGGKDPYSASKAACEIIARSMSDGILAPKGIRLGTARGGNVIGGGDFAEDRLGPDCVRAVQAGQAVTLRQPRATRPWQHVLDCLNGYLLFAEHLTHAITPEPTLNIGPEAAHDLPVLDFATAMTKALGAKIGVQIQEEQNSIEAPKLAIDAALARAVLGWQDALVGRSAIEASAAWYTDWANGADMAQVTNTEIARYQNGDVR